MSWRIVYIEAADQMKLYLDNLKVVREGQEVLIPLSDIHTILIDNQKTLVTARLINKLAEYHIIIIFCDEKHMPNVYGISPHSHYQTSLVLLKQVKWDDKIKGVMWQKILQIKITNQANILEYLRKDELCVNQLKALAGDVQFADETNREGYAAKLYFNTLFGENFIRNRDSYDGINSALNYGYIVIRSCIARSVAAHGLEPALGIGHHSQYNAFNLVDDLIEPFRPVIDLWVALVSGHNELLTKERRQQLVHYISTSTVQIGNQKQTILNAIDILIQTFIKSMNNGNPELLVYPTNVVAV
ncbi:type II CRISPR-associated endonuclease Cas1 [Listeria booriae]|uniref:CRISPR-associated endonuclease Cas1 n=1 Tax=Listeria booriae TaxID=1552123 RepID=A0A7X0ZWF8_9LIST|nr:type II CRISPR-associated endonuclease Cas1 [Listeria booriae]MBC2311775.1 type II CRISPR-associated endonuclease Cas1 [Listeria booriae]